MIDIAVVLESKRSDDDTIGSGMLYLSPKFYGIIRAHQIFKMGP